MEFVMTFRSDRLSVPMAYQYQVQSMIYSLLRRDAAYGSTLHGKGAYAEQGNVPFCLGPLSGRAKANRKEKQLTFASQVRLALRTPDAALCELLSSLLRPGLELELFGQALTLEAAESTQLVLPGGHCRIRMISPLLAFQRTEGNKTVYYNPLSGEFAPLIASNFQRKYQAQKGVLPGVLSIAALRVGTRDKVVTRYKGTWMTGWKGTYLLQGNSEVLTFLYDAGLGQRNAAGFGMFEVLGEDSASEP